MRSNMLDLVSSIRPCSVWIQKWLGEILWLMLCRKAKEQIVVVRYALEMYFRGSVSQSLGVRLPEDEKHTSSCLLWLFFSFWNVFYHHVRDLWQSMNLILQGSCDCLSSVSSPMHYMFSSPCCRWNWVFTDNSLPPHSNPRARTLLALNETGNIGTTAYHHTIRDNSNTQSVWKTPAETSVILAYSKFWKQNLNGLFHTWCEIRYAFEEQTVKQLIVPCI